MARTVSKLVPQTTKGTHMFHILAYTLQKGIGIGSYLASSSFSIGGYDWRVRYYPDGVLEEGGEGFIALYLELLSPNSEVRAYCEMMLVDDLTEARWKWTAAAPVVFSTKVMSINCQAWGAPKFIRASELEQSVFLRNNCLMVMFDITVVKLPHLVPADQAPTTIEVQVPPSDLSANFGKLLEMGMGADMHFSVQGEVFAAHRIMLAARSPVFMAQLFGAVGENNRQRIIIEDMQPAIFKALLHFIYTDSLPPADGLDGSGDNEMIRHLLIAADRYALERLKLICEGILCKSLDVETVAATLSLADHYNCRKLKDACIEYINSEDANEGVIATEGYQHLKRSCPEVFVELWEKVKATKHRKI